MKPWMKGGFGALAIAIAATAGAYFEGTRHVAYQDSGGVWTICQGHTRGVHAGETATDAACRTYLQTDMTNAYSDVRRCIKHPLTVSQAAAFTDAAYNLGAGVVCGSTLQRLANAGDVRGACEQLTRWVYADGKVLPGLVKRRKAERELCMHGLQ